MAQQQVPPPAQGMSPQEYYQYLISRGVPGWAAYDAVTAHYGTPQQAQDNAANAAKPGGAYQAGQLTGLVGGAVLGHEIVTGGEGTKRLFGSDAPSKNMTTDPSMSTPKPISATRGGATTTGTTAATTTGAGANLPDVNATFDWQTPGEFKYTPEGNVVVDTPAGQQTMTESMANDTDFLKNVNWGDIANGAMTLAQAYGAYQAYKSGDKTGAAIYGTAAATNAAAMGGSEYAAEAVPYVNVGLGVYQGYKTAQYLADAPAGSQRTRQGAAGGAMSGASIGSTFGPWGTAIGFVVGGLAGAAGSWFGSHKGKAQVIRDNIRDGMQKGGILDKNYQGSLADGSSYNFGDDGKSMKWKEIDKVAQANPNAWGKAVGLAGAMANAYGFVRPSVDKKPSKMADVAAWYGKAAVSNAGDDPTVAAQNIRHFAKQQGVTFDLIKQKLDQGLADKVISQEQYDAQLQQAHELTDGLYTPKELEAIQGIHNAVTTSSNKMGKYKPGETPSSVGAAASGQSPLQTLQPVQQGTTPQPQQWSKEAMQRELARRLARKTR